MIYSHSTANGEFCQRVRGVVLSTVSLSLYRARKRMEDQLSRIGLGRSRRKEGAAEDVPGNASRTFSNGVSF